MIKHLRQFNMRIVVMIVVLSLCFFDAFADNTELDRSSYVDGNQYENEEIIIPHVKVGLLYDENAIDRAYLDVTDGAGFQVVTYDTNRSEQELAAFDTNHVLVIKDTFYSDGDINNVCYHIRLNKSFSSFEKASNEANNYDDAFPAYYHGHFCVMVGNFGSVVEANEYAGTNEIDGHGSTTGKYGVCVLNTSNNKVLFGFDMSSTNDVVLKPVKYENNPTTNFNGKTYYGGFEIKRSPDANLSVINCVSLEDYVKGVIPYEMSPSWPIEALKAQALCARTYVAKHMNQYMEYGFDVRDDTHSQVYNGIEGATEDTDSAVDATAGKYVRYQGELCNTYYFSCDGGSTESSSLVFDQEYEYLIGKEDPFEAAVNFPNKTWSRTVTVSQLTSILNSKGYSIGNIKDVHEEFTASGNCSSLSFTDINNKTVTLDRTAYTKLGLPSCHFSVEQTKIKVVKKVKKEVQPTPTPTPTPTPSPADGAEGQDTTQTPTPTPTATPTPTPQYEYITEYYDGFAFNGGGWGHNCGMSQWGAYSMAYVYGYDYEDIIRFYFTGAYIA